MQDILFESYKVLMHHLYGYNDSYWEFNKPGSELDYNHQDHFPHMLKAVERRGICSRDCFCRIKGAGKESEFFLIPQ